MPEANERGEFERQQILSLLLQGERELLQGQGFDLDEVLRDAHHIVTDRREPTRD